MTQAEHMRHHPVCPIWGQLDIDSNWITMENVGNLDNRSNVRNMLNMDNMDNMGNT